MSDSETQGEDEPHVVVSVVSHGHGRELQSLLDCLVDAHHRRLSIVLTANNGEDLTFAEESLGDRLRILRNPHPLGFGANHNAAYRASRGDVFCVCNPDVRVPADTFEPLVRALRDRQVGVAAPRVVDSQGEVQDNVRKDLTPGRVLARVWSRRDGHEYEVGGIQPVRPDWVAGMFMAFRWEAFGAVHGFDERFFLYCEDADICRRLRQAGLRIEFVPESTIVHDAQRTSHRNLVYLSRHVRSLARYWLVPFDRNGQKVAESTTLPSSRGNEGARRN